MKDQLTTIAALPSGAGQAAHLPPEVGKTPFATGGLVPPAIFEAGKPKVGEVVTLFGVPHVVKEVVSSGDSAFTPFSTVTPIGSGAPSVPVKHLEFNLGETVLWDDPSTVYLSPGLAKMPGSPPTNIDHCFAKYDRVRTTSEFVAMQLWRAGYRTAFFMDASVGNGWEIHRRPQEVKVTQPASEGVALPSETATELGIYSFEETGLVRIGDVKPPGEKQGFEPFDYNERS